MSAAAPTAQSSAARPWAGSAVAWLVSAALTALCFVFQNRTGPTYPLTGSLETARGTVKFELLRSEEIGTDLQLMLPGPVPEGVTAHARYRRYKSSDDWSLAPLAPGTFRFTRRGQTKEVTGLGTSLPSLHERAGKYEYFVDVDDGSGWRSITGDRPIYARYKAPVPLPVLLIHVLVIFVSMALALRTGIEALRRRDVRTLTLATMGSFFLGAFVLGPAVQWYAFGVLWSGFPFGYDWTDNKVAVELLAWVIAFAVGRGSPVRARRAVLAALLVTILVYFIPHSVFGSEYDYTRGAGHGTAG